MPKGLYLTSKDVSILEGVQISNAWRSLQAIKDSLGKDKSQRVTIEEYAKYRGVSVEEVNKKIIA